MSEQAISRVLSPRGRLHADLEMMTIHLVLMLPSRSSDLPGNSGGPPSNVPLFGLAPGGVYLASSVTTGAGELLPHPFTLTRRNRQTPFPQAVSFLWHFPSRRRDWALPSTLSCGARTFLPSAYRQCSGHLSYSDIPAFVLVAFSCLPADSINQTGMGEIIS